MNKTILMGRITKDLESKSFDNGTKVLNFSIATDESYKNKEGERVEAAEFHNVVFYGKAAEIIEKYFKKGQRILISGKLRTRSWETTEGAKKYLTEVLGDHFEFIEKAGSSKSSEPLEVTVDAPDPESDLPF